MCVCIYVFTYICMYVLIMYVCTVCNLCMYMYVCIYVYIYVRTYYVCMYSM